MATSYFGFKPKHNILDEKLRMQLDVIRDATAVMIQKHIRRFMVQRKLAAEQKCVRLWSYRARVASACVE